MSCVRCAGAGRWAWIPGGGLRSAPFCTPNLRFKTMPPKPIALPNWGKGHTRATCDRSRKMHESQIIVKDMVTSVDPPSYSQHCCKNISKIRVGLETPRGPCTKTCININHRMNTTMCTNELIQSSKPGKHMCDNDRDASRTY